MTTVLAVANAGLLPAVHQIEVNAPAKYDFSYSVHDPHTGDIKDQHEARLGDTVQGSYSLVEPDGNRRVVHYTADPHNGFNAVVQRQALTHAVAHAPVALAHAPLGIAHAPLGLGLAHGGLLRAPLGLAAAPLGLAHGGLLRSPLSIAHGAPLIASHGLSPLGLGLGHGLATSHSSITAHGLTHL